MTINTCAFLAATLRRFQHAGIALWVCGGWAEELWQITPPRLHRDIDLLYPAAAFQPLDRVIAEDSAFTEIPLKRFSHKRAVMCEGVMLEFILVQGAAPTFLTAFFDGRFQLQWPADTFVHTIQAEHQTIHVASRAALAQYRQAHAAIAQAYATHQEQASIGSKHSSHT